MNAFQVRHTNASLLNKKNKFNRRYSEAVRFRDTIHRASKRARSITHTPEERMMLKKLKKNAEFSNEIVYHITQ